MKKVRTESTMLINLYTVTGLYLVLGIILNIIFNVSIVILGGIGSVFLGVINFYLKNKVWYLWFTLVPTRPIYVKLIGIFLILVGILFIFLGGLGLTIE